MTFLVNKFPLYSAGLQLNDIEPFCQDEIALYRECADKRVRLFWIYLSSVFCFTLSLLFNYISNYSLFCSVIKDKELRQRLQDSERKLGLSMPFDMAKERADQLQSEVTSLERYFLS